MCSVLAGSVKSAIVGSNQRAGGFSSRLLSSHATHLRSSSVAGRSCPALAIASHTGCGANDQDQRGGSLSRKSGKAAGRSWTVRNNCTVGRCSLFLDAPQLWRSCCCTGRKVRRSLFRKLSTGRRSWPASYSRTHPIQPLRFRKLRGDVPLGGLAAVRLGLGRCQAIALHSFATIEARRVPQSKLQPHR